MGDMHVWLQPDTFHHGPSERALTLTIVAPSAQDATDVHLAAVKQARSQDPIRGQPKPVTRIAERLRHGADESDAAPGIAAGQAIHDRWADAALPRPIHRFERPQSPLNRPAHPGFTHESVPAPILRSASSSRAALAFV